MLKTFLTHRSMIIRGYGIENRAKRQESRTKSQESRIKPLQLCNFETLKTNITR